MESELPAGVRRLALLPVKYLLQQDERFDHLCPEAGNYGEAYRDVFVAGFWGYQLHACLGVVGARFGPDVRSVVRGQFLVFFDILADAGPAVDHTLGLIESAASAGPGWSDAVPGGGASTEMKVALALLLGLPQSPVCEPDPARRLQRAGTMPPGIDWQLAQCLSRCAAGMRESFSIMLDCLELDSLVFGEASPPLSASVVH